MTIENSDIRTLSDADLNDVNGGIWGIIGRLAIGIGMTILENASHNGTKTISVGELCEQNGIRL